MNFRMRWSGSSALFPAKAESKPPVFLLILLMVAGCSDSAPRQLASADAPGSTGPAVTILFGGDTHFGEDYLEAWASRGNENVLASRGYHHSMKFLGPLANSSDLVIVNLETPVTDIANSPFRGEKAYIHRAHVQKTPAALRDLNVTAVSLANNHALDFGAEGLEQTLATLTQFGIETFGAGLNEESAARPFSHEIQLGSKAFKLLVLAGFEYQRNYDKDFSFYASGSKSGSNTLDHESTIKQVKLARKTSPDAFIVLFPHWGDNYEWRSRKQSELAHELIDAGADLILGHGAHVLQEIEQYKGRWIVYSLGNFLFNSPGRFEQKGVDPFSLVARLEVHEDQGQVRTVLRLYPVNSNNLVTHFQPYFVTGEEFQKVGSLLLGHSRNPDELETHLRTAKDESGRNFIWMDL